MADFFASPAWQEAIAILKSETMMAIWETLYSTVLATCFAYVIGLPLGVILVIGEKDGIRPLPSAFMKVLNFVINILRSVPFLILMITVIPLTRLIIGTSIGTPAMIVSLVIAAFPFVARLVESSLRETDKGVIEAARAFGATNWQILTRVMVREALPAIILNIAVIAINLLGYSAMAGVVGGGGLGDLAIKYGYNRFQTDVMIYSVAVLIVIVQIVQSIGNMLYKKLR